MRNPGPFKLFTCTEPKRKSRWHRYENKQQKQHEPMWKFIMRTSRVKHGPMSKPRRKENTKIRHLSRPSHLNWAERSPDFPAEFSRRRKYVLRRRKNPTELSTAKNDWNRFCPIFLRRSVCDISKDLRAEDIDRAGSRGTSTYGRHRTHTNTGN